MINFDANRIDCAKAQESVFKQADKIESALHEEHYTSIYRATDMDEAVRFSKSVASSGIVVLLSPACTSWDMYPNYKARGEHFKQAMLGYTK